MTEGPIDFSSLNPAHDDVAWEERIARTLERTTERAELPLDLSSLDLSSLDPYVSSDGMASKKELAIARILEASSEPVVLRLAPKALAMATLLAAASWLLVWVGGDPAPMVRPDPALAAMSWASSGEPLSLEQMGLLTGSEVSHEH